MSGSGQGLTGVAHSFEELYEDAPCGYLSFRPDGTLIRANRTFLRSVGLTAEELVKRRLQDLLAPGSRLYHGTHWGPKLDLQGHVSEVPAEIVRADGSQLSVLINAAVWRESADGPVEIRANLFDATDRRRYERELIAARDNERAGRERAERLQRISSALSDALSPEDVASAILGELVELIGADYGELFGEGVRVGEYRSAWAVDASPPVQSMEVALSVGELEVGRLALGFLVERQLTEEEQTFLATCAHQCAQALVRAQLFAETQERARHEAATARLSGRALEDIGLAAFLDEAAQLVLDILDVGAVRIVAGDGSGLAQRGEPDTGVDPAFAVLVGAGGRSYGELQVWAKEVTDREQAFLAGVARVLWNTTERRRQENLTRHQATHDPVTDLPNRVLLVERMEHEIARARQDSKEFAVFLLDIDDFKLVNDVMGHQAGDELLMAIGSRLSEALARTDLLARLGGDEFVVLGSEVGTEIEAQRLASRIGDALGAPFMIRGSDLTVRASIGVALGGGESTPDALLRDVDLAMYDAKGRGPGMQALFDGSMRHRAKERVRVEAELRTALRDGDLRVFYQPVVTARDRRVSGVEALVRWQHPERGLVPPDDFIPVAEASGLIIEVGHHVLTEACRQVVRWRAEGLVDNDFSVAVNVSWRQLTRPGFAEGVAAVLAETGLDPARLGLEITETTAMESAEHSSARLTELADLGVELLLDDFGTGASSLARLKRLPVDTLKIDRSFVRGLKDRDGEDDPIVAAILAMAHALDLTVVAEGVESEAQLARLNELGCQLIQGFLFSRPLPTAGMRALLEATATRSHPAGLTVARRVPTGVPCGSMTRHLAPARKKR